MGTVEVKISRGYVAIIDAEDAELVSKHRWYAVIAPDQRRTRVYASTQINGRTVAMHRLIMNAPRGVDVDHGNGDGLDNRKTNLRLCDDSKNQANCLIARSISGYKGVYWEPQRDRQGKLRTNPGTKPWKARLQVSGKRKFLGSFASAEQAAAVYDAAAIEAYGEFAATNAKIKELDVTNDQRRVHAGNEHLAGARRRARRFASRPRHFFPTEVAP